MAWIYIEWRKNSKNDVLVEMTSCFLRILLKFWKHLLNRTVQNTTSQNNSL